MTPLDTLTRAVAAAELDPHGGKVLLPLDEARRILERLSKLERQDRERRP